MGNSRLPAGFYKETSHMETRLHTYRLHVDAVLAVYIVLSTAIAERLKILNLVCFCSYSKTLLMVDGMHRRERKI